MAVSPFVESDGVFVLSLGFKDEGKIVDDDGLGRVVGLQGHFCDGECSPEEHLGLIEVALFLEHLTQFSIRGRQ